MRWIISHELTFAHTASIFLLVKFSLENFQAIEFGGHAIHFKSTQLNCLNNACTSNGNLSFIFGPRDLGEQTSSKTCSGNQFEIFREFVLNFTLIVRKNYTEYVWKFVKFVLFTLNIQIELQQTVEIFKWRYNSWVRRLIFLMCRFKSLNSTFKSIKTFLISKISLFIFWLNSKILSILLVLKESTEQ